METILKDRLSQSKLMVITLTHHREKRECIGNNPNARQLQWKLCQGHHMYGISIQSLEEEQYKV